MNIPTINSNCSPDLVSYVMPGNDETPASIDLYCKLLKERKEETRIFVGNREEISE
jgi:ribosomal protein S2